MTQLYGRHIGRVRLPGGRLMTLRAFRETTSELYPEPLPSKEDDDRIERLETMTFNLGRRLSSIESLKRLQEDTRSGKIGKPTQPMVQPKQAPQYVPQFIQEI